MRDGGMPLSLIGFHNSGFYLLIIPWYSSSVLSSDSPWTFMPTISLLLTALLIQGCDDLKPSYLSKVSLNPTAFDWMNAHFRTSLSFTNNLSLALTYWIKCSSVFGKAKALNFLAFKLSLYFPFFSIVTHCLKVDTGTSLHYFSALMRSGTLLYTLLSLASIYIFALLD